MKLDQLTLWVSYCSSNLSIDDTTISDNNSELEDELLLRLYKFDEQMKYALDSPIDSISTTSSSSSGNKTDFIDDLIWIFNLPKSTESNLPSLRESNQINFKEKNHKWYAQLITT